MQSIISSDPSTRKMVFPLEHFSAHHGLLSTLINLPNIQLVNKLLYKWLIKAPIGEKLHINWTLMLVDPLEAKVRSTFLNIVCHQRPWPIFLSCSQPRWMSVYNTLHFNKLFLLRRISDKIVIQKHITSLNHLTFINLYHVCFCK